MRSPSDRPSLQSNAQYSQIGLHALDPARLLLWVPLLVAVAGLVILPGLHQAALPYMGILIFVVAYNSLTLFSPLSMRLILLAHAAQVYALTLLLAWVTALYLLPTHPASPVVSLAVVLHFTTSAVFLFVQLPPLTAARWAAGTLGVLVFTALPHVWDTLGQTGVFDGVILPVTLLVSHGTLITVLYSLSTFRDRTVHAERHAHSLHELAHRDPLTGLLNRRALERDLEGVVATSGAGWRLAIVDVDGMKKVNDTLGHAAGDDLLRRFASGFTKEIGNDEQAYRIGGDEFALLLSDRQPLARTIVEAVTQDIRSTYLGAKASVGTANWRSEEAAEVWLARADAAMYRHKQGGGPGR